MTYIGTRLRYLRKQDKITQQQLADQLGIAKSTVSMYETGQREPDFEMLEKLADFFNVPMHTFFPGGETPAIPSPLPSNLVQLPASRPTVPLVGQIACGTPILAEENIEGYVELPAHIRADYALTCKGDSMINAGIRDGDVVYIRQQEEVENGQIAAVMVDGGEATLKRFYHDGNTVSLIAENPAVPPMVFSGEEINRLRVIGLSVAYIHLLEK